MPLCYGTTLFVSACLLFVIQPMAGKMLLPLYGGTPADIHPSLFLLLQLPLRVGLLYHRQQCSAAAALVGRDRPLFQHDWPTQMATLHPA